MALGFNSRTPCGVRLKVLEGNYNDNTFQFTHPVWGATPRLLSAAVALAFQFTHLVWGATTAQHIGGRAILVSIHAPRVGCDVAKILKDRNVWFQFTHPVWGATTKYASIRTASKFQFTHPVWGATSL